MLWNSLVFAKKCKENQLAQIVVYQGGVLLLGRGWLIGIICILAKSITYVKCTIKQPTTDLITLFPLMFVCVVLPHSLFLQLVLFHKLFVCFVERHGFIIFFCVCLEINIVLVSFNRSVYYWFGFLIVVLFMYFFFHRLFQSSLWKTYLSIPNEIVLFVFKP